jgi:hypothetical protein
MIPKVATRPAQSQVLAKFPVSFFILPLIPGLYLRAIAEISM